ncbi:sugar-binding domain-containing protein [Bradyrhizobium sp. INPA03-11B]|uniref:sugar-binding domain-containing protein n=1 Tax=Bradyrhizobium sp. INPA03-11B TaxID=418598 RepID=UPI00338EBAD6
MWLAIVLEEFGRHRIKLKPKLERLHPRRVLAMIRHLDMALIVVIDLSEKSKAPEYGLINRTVWRALLSVGAVGDVCGHYLDAEAHVIDHELAACVVNPPIKDPGKVRSGFPKRSCSNKDLTRWRFNLIASRFSHLSMRRLLPGRYEIDRTSPVVGGRILAFLKHMSSRVALQ